MRKIGYNDHLFSDDVRRVNENADFEVSVINYSFPTSMCSFEDESLCYVLIFI